MLLKHHYPFPTHQSPFPPIFWGKQVCDFARYCAIGGCKQQRSRGLGGREQSPGLPLPLPSALPCPR